MKVTTQDTQAYTLMPIEIRREVARLIQAGRPWSDVCEEDIVNFTYEATANGCLDVYVQDDDHELMGCAHIVIVWDVHVGWMAVLLATFVWPEYRNRGVTREFLKVLKAYARERGLRWCGYSHFTRPGVSENRYIDLEKAK